MEILQDQSDRTLPRVLLDEVGDILDDAKAQSGCIIESAGKELRELSPLRVG
jgi:hypothetical protein